MERNELKKLFELTGKRIIKKQYKYFILNRHHVSEAEVRHVLTKILDENQIYYEIEVPTEESYNESGSENKRKALIDLAIWGKSKEIKERILVEFKRGQPDNEKIKKDFNKLKKEKSEKTYGSCFFHILPDRKNENRTDNIKAKDSILKKYREAYEKSKKTECQNKWFILFILDCWNKSYYYLEKENICEIDGFPQGEWKSIK